MWSGRKEVRNCIGEIELNTCQQYCIENDKCGAFDFPTDKLNGECCMFMPENTGDGRAGRKCYIKRYKSEVLFQKARRPCPIIYHN